METGYRWLRESYLRSRRAGRSTVETGKLLGFVSARAAVWELDVGASGRHHLQVDVVAEVRFWAAYDAGTGVAGSAVAAGIGRSTAYRWLHRRFHELRAAGVTIRQVQRRLRLTDETAARAEGQRQTDALSGRRAALAAKAEARLKNTYPEDFSMRLCPETIYRELLLRDNTRLHQKYCLKLRTGRRIRKSRWLTRTGHGPTVSNKTMIDQRPASAETRLEAGHWEGDLIIGIGSASAMVTLRERTTQYGIIINLPHDHTATSVNIAVTEAFADMPAHMKRTLTSTRFASETASKQHPCDTLTQ